MGGLLDSDFGARRFELLLDLLGLVLGHVFLHRFRRALDQVLGFLQPQARDRADFLDDGDLLRAGARQLDGEFRLLFRRRGSAGGCR